MKPSENVFEREPAKAPLNGAGAQGIAAPAERSAGSISRDTAPSAPPAAHVETTERLQESGTLRAGAGPRGMAAGGPPSAVGRPAPGVLLLPEEVYPDTGARSRAVARLRRLLLSEPERREAAVDRRLAQISASVMPAGRLVVACSPKGGSGKTTVVLGLAQALATLHWPALVVDLDLTGGTAALHAPSRNAQTATLVDVLAAIDAGGARGPSDLARYLTPLTGGAALLPGPRTRNERQAITVAQVERLVVELARYWPVVILDTSPGSGDRDEAQQWILEHATDVIAVAVPLRVDSLQARAALGELCAMLAETPITVALNKVPPRPDAPTRRVMSVPLAPDRNAHRVEIPHDPRLAGQLDRAALELYKLARPTRLGFKELAAALADGWVQCRG
jgi:MinD-like ATPase involved in chromosome partitioning or flagellar assembly